MHTPHVVPANVMVPSEYEALSIFGDLENLDVTTVRHEEAYWAQGPVTT